MIREYLLGQLSDEEQERVEERLMTDQDFFEQAMMAETELIDDYLAGDLAEAESFENYFLSAPQQRQRLRAATIFQRYVSESASAEVPHVSEGIQTPTSWLRRLLAGIQIHNVPRKVEVD
ncbi:MAG TPA: hypothetical protein VGW12_00210 [Pyrinomonadaceae bacterium]|nr:hypothetical protein [Pyrinomonadaceae bacterium]